MLLYHVGVFVFLLIQQGVTFSRNDIALVAGMVYA